MGFASEARMKYNNKQFINRDLKTIEAIKEYKEMKYINKKKSIVEIIICFSLMLFLTVFVNIFGKDFGLWLGILTYWLPSIILRQHRINTKNRIIQ